MRLKPALVVTLGVAVACSDPVGESSSTYELVLFDGSPLPVELPTGGTIPLAPAAGLVIRSGTLAVGSDGSCRRTIFADVPAGVVGPVALSNHESWWGCVWTQTGSSMSITWTLSSDLAIPLVTDSVAGSIREDAIRLDFETGIVCVTVPCPTGWSEAYERIGRT